VVKGAQDLVACTMERELATLADIMIRAGQEALRLAVEGFDTYTKADRSPVTSADLAVNQMLRDHLSAAFPDDGWLSEETADSPDRLSRPRVWIVDPIDGTRAFVRGVPEFCLSAALVEKGRPIVAAIFNPSTGELFSAIRNQGLRMERKAPPTQPPFSVAERPVALVNPWEHRAGHLRSLEPHMRCRPIGSIAYALALVASEQADAAVMLQGGNEWDIAAGILLVEEGGGSATTPAGEPFAFNRTDPRLQGTVAIGAKTPEAARTQLLRLGRRASAGPASSR